MDTRAVPLDNPTVTAITRPLGDPVASTPDGRLVAWSLESAPAGGGADRERLLEPVLVGVSSAWTIGADTASQDSGPRTSLFTSNLSDSAVSEVAISVDVESLGAPEREMVVRDGTRTLGRWTVREGTTTPVRLTVPAPPGYHRFMVEFSGAPVRDEAEKSVSARLSNLVASSPEAVRIAGLQEQADTGVILP